MVISLPFGVELGSEKFPVVSYRPEGLAWQVVFSPQTLYFAVAEFSEFFIWHLPLLSTLGTFYLPYPQCYFPAQFGFST